MQRTFVWMGWAHGRPLARTVQHHRSISRLVGAYGLGCAIIGVAVQALAAGASPIRAQEFVPRRQGAAVVQGEAHGTTLERRISLDLERVGLVEAIDAIRQRSGVAIAYRTDAVAALPQRVSFHGTDVPLSRVFAAILAGTGLTIDEVAPGQLYVKRESAPPPSEPPTGSIHGTVTDAKTRDPIASVTLHLVGTRFGALTDASGAYRIAGIPPGTYTVAARRIGYEEARQTAVVDSGTDVTVDLAMSTRPTMLDETVTIGTMVATQVKALPTPVSVITAADVAQQRPSTMTELVRQAVPGAVSWVNPDAPFTTAMSVRGASTLSTGGGQMKVFVDGIEVADPSFAALDPASIDRIEVIRGPQAAAIYGSDAIGGAVQIFTKRGDQTSAQPHVSAEAAFGLVQTPYDGHSDVLRQSYKIGMDGGAQNVTYHIGADYAHSGKYVPGTKSSSPSLYGGMRYNRGIVNLDVSGRVYQQTIGNPVAPELTASGFFFYAPPLPVTTRYRSQTIASRLTVAPVSWWSSTVTMGIDRLSNDNEQTAPHLTSPADTMLLYVGGERVRSSLSYTTAIEGGLGRNLRGSLTAGIDHWSLPISNFTSLGPSTTGGLSPIAASRSVTTNTGFFGQAQLGIHEALFVTAGLRAEKNTNFGDSLGTPVSPRVGISYVQTIGAVTVKVRSSYGRAIRPPAPGAKLESIGAISVTRANPRLGPERQSGGDLGIDMIIGEHGSLSVSYYDQTADNLIDMVRLPDTAVATYQNQNVGRVKNTGVEVEGTLHAGSFSVRGNYAYTRARVARLSPDYSGNQIIGDQVFLTPKHTAGVSLFANVLRRATVALGVTYVGRWTYYDDLAYVKCLGGTAPCRNSTYAEDRSYLMAYPAVVKANATVTWALTPRIATFAAIDNLTNTDAHEISTSFTVVGRISTIGLRVSY